MFKKTLLAFGLLSALTFGAVFVPIGPALDQNSTCATRPVGDASNACASTKFVSNSAPTLWVVGLNAFCSSPTIGTALYYTGTQWACVKSGFVSVYMFGAKCDNSTDDYTAIQAAITSFPATGGILYGPYSGTCKFGTFLDYKGKDSIRTQGFGGQSSTSTASGLIFTGTGTRAIDFRDTSWNTIDGFNIYTDNPAFTGIIIDAGATNPGVTISSAFKLSNSILAPVGSGTPTCLNISEAQLVVVDHVTFAACGPGIKGQNILGQNTVTKIFVSVFTSNVGSAIIDCGESWTLLGNTFEQDSLGHANAFSNSSSRPCKNITISGSWMGDADATGTWISLTANGASITGNRISNGAVGIALTAGGGYDIRGGNVFESTTGITCTTSPTGGQVNTNRFIGVTTPVGTGCINFNLANNNPDISPANGTPTIASGACGAGSNGTISGTNSAGSIFIGAVATTLCTISFSTTLDVTPSPCTVTPGSTAAADQNTTRMQVGLSTTTGWTIGGSALANANYSYSCPIPQQEVTMPSKSPKQARTMAAAAHNPKFAKKVGIPQKVAKEFNRADTGKGTIKPKKGK